MCNEIDESGLFNRWKFEGNQFFIDNEFKETINNILDSFYIFEEYNYSYGNTIKKNKINIIKKIYSFERKIKGSYYFYLFQDIDILNELKTNVILENKQSVFYCILRISEMLCVNLIMNYIQREQLITTPELKKKIIINKDDCKFKQIERNGKECILDILDLIKRGNVGLREFNSYLDSSNYKESNSLDPVWLLYLNIITELRNKFGFHLNYYEHSCFQEDCSNINLLINKVFSQKLLDLTEKLKKLRPDDVYLADFYSNIKFYGELKEITEQTSLFDLYNKISEDIFIFSVSYVFYLSDDFKY